MQLKWMKGCRILLSVKIARRCIKSLDATALSYLVITARSQIRALQRERAEKKRFGKINSWEKSCYWNCFWVYYQHVKQAESYSKQSVGRLPCHNSVISPPATEYGDKSRDNTQRCLVSIYTELCVCCCSLRITGAKVISLCSPCFNNCSLLRLEGAEADIVQLFWTRRGQKKVPRNQVFSCFLDTQLILGVILQVEIRS